MSTTFNKTSECNFDFSSIMLIIVILVFIVIVYYYFWYVKNDASDNMKDISISMLNDPDTTIIDVLKKISKKYPHCLAMKHNGTEISYSEYYDKVYNFAEKLLCDIGPHVRTGIMCDNRPEGVISHMGTMMSGGISISICSLDSNDKNIGEIINNLCIDVLVIDKYKTLIDLFDTKIPTVKKILYIDIDLTDEITIMALNNIEENNNHLSIIPYNEFNTNAWTLPFNSSINVEFKNPHSDDIAQIIYDKNNNKGIHFTHKNIISSMRACLNAIQSKSNICIQLRERFVSHLKYNNTNTIPQLIDIYIPIISSGAIYFPTFQTDKKSILMALKDAKPTILLSSFNMWNTLLTEIKEKQHDTQKLLNKLFINKLILKEMGLDEIKYCIIMSESSIHFQNQKDQDNDIKHLVDQFEEFGIELCVTHGIKNAMGPISMGVPGCSKGGKGLPTLGIKISHDTNEISVKGDQLEKNKNENEWLKTGKNGYIDRSGFLFFD